MNQRWLTPEEELRKKRAAQELHSRIFGAPEASAQAEEDDSGEPQGFAKPRVPSADAGEHGIELPVKKPLGEMMYEALVDIGAYTNHDDLPPAA